MQFIESSAFGVRSARLTFVSSTASTQVTLFPMVHVGEPEFYRSVYEDAAGHAVVLLEGVRSPISARITRSYRWAVGKHGLAKLVVQPRFTETTSNPQVIVADLNHMEFLAEWRKVQWWVRGFVWVLAPLIGLHRRWRYSLERLAKEMGCDDQPSLSELLAISPETGALTAAILDARDRRLIERLRTLLDSPTPPVTIAIIYGARHMRAVVKELCAKRNYVPRTADWRTIWSLG